MNKKIISFSTLCILATAVALNAQLDWNSADADGDWNTPASWDGGVVPGSADFVRIDGGNATVSGVANVNKINTGGTSALTVDSGGSLTVADILQVGEVGDAAAGEKTGTLELNSGGQITVNTSVMIGSWNDIAQESFLDMAGGTFTAPKLYVGSGAAGTANLSGGTFTVGQELYVGGEASGTLNLSGGTLDVSPTGGGWRNLKIGNSEGNGTVNMTGGTLLTDGVNMDNGGNNGNTGNRAAGTATFNLDGGILVFNNGWAGNAGSDYNGDGVVQYSDDSVFAIGDGVFQWKGNKTAVMDAYIADGFVTFANPSTSGKYPDVTPEQSWTSAGGATTLYADTNEVRSGYTTVWAESNDTDGDGYNNSVDAFPDDVNEWADADGDNVGDNADVHDGYNDAELSDYLSNNNYALDDGGPSLADHNAVLDQLNNAQAARAGSSVIDVTEAVIEGVTTQVADITLRVEQTSDVSDWSSATTSDHTIQLSAPAGASFYRFTIPE